MLHKISKLSTDDKRVVECLLDRLATDQSGCSEADGDTARRRLTFGDSATNGDSGPTSAAIVTASHSSTTASAAKAATPATMAPPQTAISLHNAAPSPSAAAAAFVARRSIASLAHNTSRTKRLVQDGIGAILERIDLLKQASDDRLAAANAASALALRKSQIAMELAGGTTIHASTTGPLTCSTASPNAAESALALAGQGGPAPEGSTKEARKLARASLQAFASRIGSIVADNVVTSITNSCLVSVEDDDSARALMAALEQAVLGRFRRPAPLTSNGDDGGGDNDRGRRVRFSAANSLPCRSDAAASDSAASDSTGPGCASMSGDGESEGDAADQGGGEDLASQRSEHQSPSAKRPGRKRRRRDRSNAVRGDDEMPAHDPQHWVDRLLEMAAGNPTVIGGILRQHTLHERDVRQARVRELRLRTELECARTAVARAEAEAAAAEEARLGADRAATKAAETGLAASEALRGAQADARQARSEAKAAQAEAQGVRQQREEEEAAWQQAAAEAQQERSALQEQIDLLRGQLEDGREREAEMQQARVDLEQQLRDQEVVRRNLSATIDSRAAEARKAEAKLKAQHQREMQQHLQEREATMKRLSKAVRKLKGKQRLARERADRVRQVILAAFGANRPVTAEEYRRCEALFSEMPTGDSDLDQSVDGSQVESLPSRTPARAAKQ